MLLSEGYEKECETVVSAIRDRYDGEKRNPFNEIECGSNYARSMASFGLLMAFSGFKFDRGAQMLGFDFKLPQERQNTFWCLGDVWGNYAEDGRTGLLTVEQGSFTLRRLLLPGTVTKLRRNGADVPFRQLPEGGAELAAPVVISAGSPPEIFF